jgi:hypothetical protein
MIEEDEKKRKSLILTMGQIEKKLSEFDNVISFSPHDPDSFTNTYEQNIADMFAEIQTHYSVNVYEISIIKFYTFKNNIERKLKNSTKPKTPISPI